MTAMATANKPFDLTSAEPSGYYINYPEIRTQNRQDLVDRCKTGMKQPSGLSLRPARLGSSGSGRWLGSSDGSGRSFRSVFRIGSPLRRSTRTR